MDEDLKRALERVIAPLIEADEGELYWIPASGNTVRLHLRGRFSGCPGHALVTEHILRPAILASVPGSQIVVTAGALLPDGAERVRPAGDLRHQ